MLSRDEIEKLDQALRDGFVITPRSHEMPSREDRDSQIQVIVRVVYSIWNREKRPAHIQQIVREALQTILYEVKMGLWKRPVPSRRTLERSTNYAADPRWYEDKEDKTPKIIAVRAGWYLPNPQFFDPETAEKMRKLFCLDQKEIKGTESMT